MKTPSKKKFIEAAATGGGLFAGAGISQGANSFIPSKEKNKTAHYAIKASLALLPLIGCAFIPDKGAAYSAAKGACLGVSVVQTMDLVKGFAKGSKIDQPTTKPATKFAKYALGLGGADCGCDGNAYHYPSHQRPLNAAYTPYEPEIIANPFDVQPNQGQLTTSIFSTAA